MATFNKVDIFVQDLAQKQHNLATDVLKVALTNTSPVTGSTVVTAGTTDLATGGGYTAGGGTVTTTSAVQTGGILKLVVADLVFTATTGFGPFRYAILHNSTNGNKIIGWYDYGSSISLQASETFTVDFDQTNGVLTIQ